jgi:hypothetical protein
MTTHVRLAVPEDITELLALGRLIHAESGLMPLDDGCLQDFTWRLINQDRAILGVIGQVGYIEGAVCLTIGQFWYTAKLHLEEIFTFVRPECRKSENMKSLVDFAKTSSDKLGIPLLVGIISTERTAAKIRLYERRLGKQSGAYFIYGKDKAA